MCWDHRYNIDVLCVEITGIIGGGSIFVFGGQECVSIILY